MSIIASEYIEFSILQELPLLKNDDVSNNWQNFHEIFDQFDKSVKIYVKIFDTAGLLASSNPGRVNNV